MNPSTRSFTLLVAAALAWWTLGHTADAAVPDAVSTAGKEGQTTREAKAKAVMAFYDALDAADFVRARQYVGDYYVEHDPLHEDGLPGLQKALDYNQRHGIHKTAQHLLTVVDGDYVVLLTRVSALTLPPGMAGGPPGGLPGGPPTGAPANGGPPTSGPPPGMGPGARSGGPGAGPPAGAAGPPKGINPDTTDLAEIFRLHDGKIVEHWITVQGWGSP